MQQWISDFSILAYMLITIVSVLYSITIFDDLHKETGDSGYIELVLCTILVMIGSLTFFCIPWCIGSYIHYRKKMKALEIERAEKRERIRKEIQEQDEELRKHCWEAFEEVERIIKKYENN